MSREPQVDVQLRNVVDGLVNHTQGAVSREDLTTLVDEIYDRMAATSSVQTFLPVLVGRAALAKVQQDLPQAQEALRHQPAVLIVCQENAGRSQAAAALFRHYAPGLLYVESAGLTPSGQVLPEVVDSLAAHGVHLVDESTALQPDMVRRADHVIVIGDAAVDGQRWQIPELGGLPPAQVAGALVGIDEKVREALAQWLPGLELGDPVMQGVADPV